MCPQDLDCLVSRNKLIVEFRLGVEYLADCHFAWLLLLALKQGRYPLFLWDFEVALRFPSDGVYQVWNNWL